MDPNAAAEFIRILGSLASMTSAYIAIKRENRELDTGNRIQILNAGMLAARAGENISTDIRVVQALPKDIGDAVTKRIERRLRQYADVIKSPVGFAEIDRETEYAEFEICHALRLVMKHNKGRLPTKKFRDLWEAFNCDEKDH